MPDVYIYYGESKITDLIDTDEITLKTNGKFCSANITIDYKKPRDYGKENEIINRTIS